MTGLREPPKKEQPTRVFARFLVLVILLLVAGVVIWTSVTNQQIELVEDVSIEQLELEDVVEVDGLQINLSEGSGGVIPVVLLHDRDVVGGAMMNDVAGEVSGRFRTVQIDLPGYGFSSRVTEPSTPHTVAAMAETVMTIIEERFTVKPVLVGVGLGGKVAAEIAVVHPDMIRGLVMVDVDFWKDRGWRLFVQKLPFVGEAATYTLEAGGRFGYDLWAPNCADGGWCPSSSLQATRTETTKIRGTTASLNSFIETPVSSQIPSDLDTLTVPAAYVWSSNGVVPRRNVDRVVQAVPDLMLTEVSAWKVHLENPEAVAAAIDSVGR